MNAYGGNRVTESTVAGQRPVRGRAQRRQQPRRREQPRLRPTRWAWWSTTAPAASASAGNKFRDQRLQAVAVRDAARLRGGVPEHHHRRGHRNLRPERPGRHHRQHLSSAFRTTASLSWGTWAAPSVAGNTVAGQGSTAIWAEEAAGAAIGENNLLGWAPAYTVDKAVGSVFQPLTLVWIVLGGLLLVTAVVRKKTDGADPQPLRGTGAADHAQPGIRGSRRRRRTAAMRPPQPRPAPGCWPLPCWRLVVIGAVVWLAAATRRTPGPGAVEGGAGSGGGTVSPGPHGGHAPPGTCPRDRAAGPPAAGGGLPAGHRHRGHAAELQAALDEPGARNGHRAQPTASTRATSPPPGTGAEAGRSPSAARAGSILDGGRLDDGYVLPPRPGVALGAPGLHRAQRAEGRDGRRTTHSVLRGLDRQQHRRRGHPPAEIQHRQHGAGEHDQGHRAAETESSAKGSTSGTAESNWCDISSCEPDKSDRNEVAGNDISGDIRRMH